MKNILHTKRLIALLIATLLLITLASCLKEKNDIIDNTTETESTTEAENDTPKPEYDRANCSVPDDFSFMIEWSHYGISSYDSATNKLIKIKHSTRPEDYETEYVFTNSDYEEIYSLILELDEESFPDGYVPYGSVSQKPMLYPYFDRLTIRSGDSIRRINGIGNSCIITDGENYKKFSKAFNKILDILRSSEEWKALPEFDLDEEMRILIDSRKPIGEGLDFYLKQDVKDYDFSEFDEIFGWFGAREFLGREYKKTADGDGVNCKPKYYVSYLVTAYPDYADGGAYITSISITDPKVSVYGLSTISTFDEFDAVFTGKGYTVSEDRDSAAAIRHVAIKDSVCIVLTQPKDGVEDIIPSLNISVEVTNRDGIVF